MRERLKIHRRPLTDAERADLDREATKAESTERQALARAIRISAVVGLGVGGVLSIVWWASRDEHPTRVLVTTLSAISVYLLFAVWYVWAARSRLKAVRVLWRAFRVKSRSEPIVEFDVRPVRAWKAAHAWILDVGENQALLMEWDQPDIRPTTHIVLRFTASGFIWTDEFENACENANLPFDWDSLPANHPLRESYGPAVFRLGADPIASLVAFEEGSFPLGMAARKADTETPGRTSIN